MVSYHLINVRTLACSDFAEAEKALALLEQIQVKLKRTPRFASVQRDVDKLVALVEHPVFRYCIRLQVKVER